MEKKETKLYFDGACFPRNPGYVATWGYWGIINREIYEDCGHVQNPNNELLSCNLAEYEGLRQALLFIQIKKVTGFVDIFGDSQLVINQMNRRWKVKQGIYKKVALECLDLKKALNSIRCYTRYIWISRWKNTRADKLTQLV